MIIPYLKRVFFIGFFILFSTVLYSQSNYSDIQIKTFVEEVYCDHASDLVFDKPERYKVIKSFLSRVDIQLRTDIDIDKKFDNYLELPLNDKYIKSPQRDNTYSLYFNPLRYKVSMFPVKKKIYRIGNTQYLLTINPLN